MTSILPGKSSVSSSGREQFLRSLTSRISERMTLCDSSESLKMLTSLKKMISAEIDSADLATADLATLCDQALTAGSPEQLHKLLAALKPLLGAQFAVRPSSATMQKFSSLFFDNLFRRLLELTLQKHGGKGIIVVSGELGRMESLFARRGSILFIYPDGEDGHEPSARGAADDFEAGLALLLPFISTVPGKRGCWFWSGTISEWSALLSSAINSGYSDLKREQFGFSGALAHLADARVICGDPGLSESVAVQIRLLIAEATHSDHFRSYTVDVSSMKVALGLFGWLKTVRSEGQSGMLALSRRGLNPMVDAVRAYSLTYPLTETSTRQRIQKLLSLGVIGVALGERLLEAWQFLTKKAARLELANPGSDDLFLDPHHLDEEEKDQLKEGLDDLLTLQRLLYQHISSGH